jgi:hypothetical protein
MKRLRLLGLMLMALFALGATAAATSALAVEPGILTLEELASLKILHEIEPEVAEANSAKLVAKETIECKKLAVLSPNSLTPGKTHFTLVKDVDLHFSECAIVGSGIKCKTGSDTNGTLLVLVDVHTVAFLVGTELVPGLLFLVLNEALEAKPIKIVCGVITVEVRGVATAKVEVLNESLVQENVESKRFGVEAKPGLTCDTSDTLCKEELEPNPLEASFKAGVFEKATETTGLQKLAFDKKVTWDF